MTIKEVLLYLLGLILLVFSITQAVEYNRWPIYSIFFGDISHTQFKRILYFFKITKHINFEYGSVRFGKDKFYYYDYDNQKLNGLKLSYIQARQFNRLYIERKLDIDKLSKAGIVLYEE